MECPYSFHRIATIEKLQLEQTGTQSVTVIPCAATPRGIISNTDNWMLTYLYVETSDTLSHEYQELYMPMTIETIPMRNYNNYKVELYRIPRAAMTRGIISNTDNWLIIMWKHMYTSILIIHMNTKSYRRLWQYKLYQCACTISTVHVVVSCYYYVPLFCAVWLTSSLTWVLSLTDQSSTIGAAPVTIGRESVRRVHRQW